MATLAFAEVRAGTRVDVTIELRFEGLQRIAGPVFGALYGRAWARGLARLKRLMESGAL